MLSAKAEFRVKAKVLRNNIKNRDIASIKSNLFSLEIFKNAQNIFSYSSFGSEVDTFDINQKIMNEFALFLPKVYGDDMLFHKISSFADLEIGAFDILEPIDSLPTSDIFDIIIVPALAFSEDKFRIGYGKGYYDKFLRNKQGIKVGICFDEQISDFIPYDNFDIKMDMIVTNKRIIF